MQSGTETWVSMVVGGVMLLALVICGGAFTIGYFQTPKSDQGRVEAPRQTEGDKPSEKARLHAAPSQAEEQEAQAFASANEAVQSVRTSLADPDSALFKDVWAVRGQIAGAPVSVFACGTVNAKNGFGGYVGYTPFVAIGSTVLTPQDGIFERVFRQVCLGGEKLFPVAA